MCGICGKLTFSNTEIKQSLIQAMCDTLVHRGPDDDGIFCAPHIGLGQRRLSIIDLSTSATAPLANEDGSVWVVFNGEIYNFQSLRAELETKGHRFRSGTDTEVIVHLYEEYGLECLAKLHGMFAFALWDSGKKRLFAARDRLGKKPLCYTHTGYSLLFGSEIKAITTDPEVSVSPNFYAIDQYLTYQYVPSPLTAFENIYKLPPAHYLTCSVDGTLTIKRYWSPPAAEKSTASSEEIQTEIVERLREAVRSRMVADVPLGAFLSGGIDSATIVALMAQESSQPVKTFSIGFEDAAFNELPYARLVAERYATEHYEFIVKPDAAAVLPLLVRHYNEPFADVSALPTYYVSRMTRQQVTVALSGDGGDENFAGYDRYARILGWSRFDRSPAGVRTFVGKVGRGTLDRLPYHNTAARGSRAFMMLASDLRDRYLLEMTIGLKPQEKQIAYTPHFRELIRRQPLPADAVAAFSWDGSMDALDWMMRHDQNFYLPDCLMVKVDIASMANSLEVRSPFLDHGFVEFAATIPSSLKRDASGGKTILKKAVRSLLPPEILTRRKTGFGVPLARWFRTDLSETLRSTLLDERAQRRGLFEPRFVKKLVEEHIAGQRDWSNRLWTLLFLEMWFREFID